MWNTLKIRNSRTGCGRTFPSHLHSVFALQFIARIRTSYLSVLLVLIVPTPIYQGVTWNKLDGTVCAACSEAILSSECASHHHVGTLK